MSLAITNSEETVETQSNTNELNFPDDSLELWAVSSFYSRPIVKSAPTDLKESINSTTDAGAQLFVQNEYGAIIAQTDKFFLSGFSFGMKERTQLLETFSAPSISFFGENARIYNFAGSAVDYAGSRAHRFYQSSLIKMYDDVLRGTLLAERGHIAILTILNHTIFGYPLAFQSSYDARRDKLASFTMNWLVTEHTLTLPGVVEEEQLIQSYRNRVDLTTEETRHLSSLSGVIQSLTKFFYFKYWAEGFGSSFNFLMSRDWGSITPFEIDAAFTKDGQGDFNSALSDLLTNVKDSILALLETSDYSPILATIFTSPLAIELKEAITTTFSVWKAVIDSLWKNNVFQQDKFIVLKQELNKLQQLYNRLLLTQRAHLAQASALQQN